MCVFRKDCGPTSSSRSTPQCGPLLLGERPQHSESAGPARPQCCCRCGPSVLLLCRSREICVSWLPEVSVGHMTHSGPWAMGRSLVCRVYSRAPNCLEPSRALSRGGGIPSMSVWLHPRLDPGRGMPGSGTGGTRQEEKLVLPFTAPTSAAAVTTR